MLSPPTAIKYVIVSWLLFYALAIVFGAPFFSEIVATATLAGALSLVSVVPSVLLFNSEERVLEILIHSFVDDKNLTTKESVVLLTSTFSVIGAWAAAAVHPLDWDRWWQRYPLPSLSGCFIGALVGLFIGLARSYDISNRSKRR